MKTIKLTYLLFIALLLILTSCNKSIQITKRQHLKGFYLAINNNKTTHPKETKNNTKIDEPEMGKFDPSVISENSIISGPSENSEKTSTSQHYPISNTEYDFTTTTPLQITSKKNNEFNNLITKPDKKQYKQIKTQDDKNVLALLSLVLGITSIIPGLFFGTFGLPFSIAAIVLGIIALKKANDGAKGKGMAIAGIILGAIYLLFLVLALVFIIALFSGII